VFVLFPDVFISSFSAREHIVVLATINCAIWRFTLHYVYLRAVSWFPVQLCYIRGPAAADFNAAVVAAEAAVAG